MVFFAFEQPNAVKGTKSIQIGKISQEKSVDSKQSRSHTGSLMNGYHSHSPSRNESRNPSLKRLVEKRCPKKSQNHNSLHRQATFEPISEENSPNGTRKAENLPITDKHSTFGRYGHYTTILAHQSSHKQSQMTATATGVRMPYLTRNRAKVESPSPNTNHRVSGGSMSLFSCFL